MKIKKIEKSTIIELETIEDHEEFSEFLNKKDQEKSSNDTFNKVIENDLEG